ncbi:hypothetical protein LTS08_004352 [Lithohypha guttulata]|uniref:Uncharacterized protein n=1 Tax=Lithohypha guttulata TaxID=1690604 RepID=A0AAN7Y6J1_9EURO|nr:hypothetical protein LTR05_003506 [Lithohypha guttulata]KAK5101893.1 hypothetical protein LTS08_004352 [Lithohypha guttulata]
MPPQQRPIKRLLVVNRGEIVIRILQACHELPSPPTTFALYTETDSTHITLGRPDHAIKILSPAVYTDINNIIKIAKENQIDAIHPGYGFLSESAEFSQRMWNEANVLIVGPGWEVLERTGDKLKAKALAEECGVPVLDAMKQPTNKVKEVEAFAERIGYPIMIKAVDGGGGRGIRLVEHKQSLQNAVDRCISESPSRTVFAEQAAIKGFKHIEVQILGDGRGGVKHLWERDCSVQRRFQKIVEVAPTPVSDRRTVAQVVESAMSMASKLQYLGLGTFEYLVNVGTGEFFFLEINPRVQVEHTISECIRGIDLVREQLLIAQGQTKMDNQRLGDISQAGEHPGAASIQLRLCAEDPSSNFALSIGKVADIVIPSGNGVRVDSHLSKGGSIGSDYDNMMAKIIVTASTWEQTLAKAQRALAETRVNGVKTNLDLLRAIVADKTFRDGNADTTWLENNMPSLIARSQQIGSRIESASASLPALPTSAVQAQGIATSGVSFRKGDAWTLHLEGDNSSKEAHHLSIDRLVRNDFPEAMVADISFTAPGEKPLVFKATIASTTSSAGATASTHKRGDSNNKDHVIVPMSGKLIEVLVGEGDEVKENDIIAFVKQMKMELEVRSPRSGIVDWVIELENEDGDDVAEGVLLVQLKASKPALQSKL